MKLPGSVHLGCGCEVMLYEPQPLVIAKIDSTLMIEFSARLVTACPDHKTDPPKEQE